MGRLPAVEPFSSCGGHEDPDEDRGQVGEDGFYVNFQVDLTADGWRGLAILVEAVGVAHVVHEEDVEIRAWMNADTGEGDPEALSFELKGRNGADPDRLASLTEEAARRIGP